MLSFFNIFFLCIRFRHDTWTRTICPWTRRDTLPYSCSCILGSDTILEPGQSVPGCGGILYPILVFVYQVQTRYLNPDNLSLDAEGYFTLFLFLYIRCRHDTWTRTICPWTRRDTLPYSCSCISGADTILEPGQSIPGREGILNPILVLTYQVQTRYLNPDNLSLDADGYFTNPEVLQRVPSVFLLLGD